MNKQNFQHRRWTCSKENQKFMNKMKPKYTDVINIVSAERVKNWKTWAIVNSHKILKNMHEDMIVAINSIFWGVIPLSWVEVQEREN